MLASGDARVHAREEAASESGLRSPWSCQRGVVGPVLSLSPSQLFRHAFQSTLKVISAFLNHNQLRPQTADLRAALQLCQLCRVVLGIRRVV